MVETKKKQKVSYFNSDILYDHLKFYLHLKFKTVKQNENCKVQYFFVL